MPDLRILRPDVEQIRAEIDRWWQPVLEQLGEARDWTWMGLPDRIRERLTPDQLTEWQDLQERYKWIDS